MAFAAYSLLNIMDDNELDRNVPEEYTINEHVNKCSYVCGRI